jgi:hypothetical protein
MAKDKKVNIAVTYFSAINYEWHILNKLVAVLSAVRLSAIILNVAVPSKEASSLQYIQKQNPFFSTKFYLKDFVKKKFQNFPFFLSFPPESNKFSATHGTQFSPRANSAKLSPP